MFGALLFFSQFFFKFLVATQLPLFLCQALPLPSNCSIGFKCSRSAQNARLWKKTEVRKVGEKCWGGIISIGQMEKKCEGKACGGISMWMFWFAGVCVWWQGQGNTKGSCSSATTHLFLAVNRSVSNAEVCILCGGVSPPPPCLQQFSTRLLKHLLQLEFNGALRATRSKWQLSKKNSEGASKSFLPCRFLSLAE